MGLVLGPTPAPTAPGTHGFRNPDRPPQRTGGRGSGQRLTSDAPHNGGRPPPLGTAPHHPHGMQPPQGMQAKGTVLGPHTHTPVPRARGCRTQTARPVGGQAGEGERLTSDAPHNGGRPPPADALPPAPQRARPARKGARCAAGDGSPRPHRPNPGQPSRGTRMPAPEDGRLVEGQRLTPDTPHRGSRPPPQGTAPHHPRGTHPPQGMQAKGTVLGPHTHTPAPTACGWRTPTARPVGGQFWEGERLTTDSPHNGGRHPSGNARTPPPQQATPARKGAHCGAGAGSHARTDRAWDTRVAEPRPPGSEDGQPGEGHSLTPDAPHNGGGPPPPGTAPHYPRGTQPPQGMQASGTVLGPHTNTPAPTARGWRTPTARPVGGQSGEGERLTSDAPHNGGRRPSLGRPSATPTASKAGPQGGTLWGRCWVPTPAPTAPGTHGLRKPGCPPQRTGGRGRDSA